MMRRWPPRSRQPGRNAASRQGGCLAAGKGVIVCARKEQSLQAIDRIMRKGEFGDAGSRIIIEERLDGREVCVLALVDGNTILPLETAQDHKAAFDDDRGPNTGGKGAYSPAGWITPEMMDQIVAQILVPTVHTMKRRGRTFRGVLYAGLMVTNQGPKVLEFNVRLGDPEAQPILMRLKSDLAEVLLATAEGRCTKSEHWSGTPARGVRGDGVGRLPQRLRKGASDPRAGRCREIAARQSLPCRDGPTRRQGGEFRRPRTGSHGAGRDHRRAKLNAYQAVKLIRWDGAWCRHDISDKARL